MLHLIRFHMEVQPLLPKPYGWVSLVALAGEGMVGRLASSLLIHGDKADWVARNTNDYVSIASSLAREGPRDGMERLRLRRSMQSSALADGQRLSRELNVTTGNLDKASSHADNFRCILQNAASK